MTKGSTRKKIKRYNKTSPDKNNFSSLRSKVANTLLGKEVKINTESLRKGEKKFTKLGLKRNYSYINNDNENDITVSETCIICDDICLDDDLNTRIECSKCKNLYHRKCIQITERYPTLHNLCKITYICIICLIERIPSTKGLDIITECANERKKELTVNESIIDRLAVIDKNKCKEKIHEEVFKRSVNKNGEVGVTEVDTTEQEEIENHTSHENVEKERKQDGGLNVSTNTDIFPNSVNIEEDVLKNVPDLLLDSNRKGSSQDISGKATSKEGNTEPKEGLSSKIEFNEYFNKERVILIDGVVNVLSEYNSSTKILREIKRYSNIDVLFAYRLAKGGIAIHLQNKEERDRLLQELTPSSFNNSVKHIPEQFSTLFIKGIETSVLNDTIINKLNQKGIKNIEVKRLRNFVTHKPIETVKLSCSKETASLLLNTQLIVNNKECKIEEKKTKAVRCFNCQLFGHIARNCIKEKNCVICSESHINIHCTNKPKCANCKSEHSAAFIIIKCPVRVLRDEILTSKYAEYQHIETAAQNGDQKLRTTDFVITRGVGSTGGN